jgi:hypothetical protein
MDWLALIDSISGGLPAPVIVALAWWFDISDEKLDVIFGLTA